MSSVQTAKRLLWLPLPSENLSPDLKRSRLLNLIWSDVRPGVMLMNITGLPTFQRQSWRNKSWYSIDSMTSVVQYLVVIQWLPEWINDGKSLTYGDDVSLIFFDLHITENVKTNCITLNCMNVSHISMPATPASQCQLVWKNKMLLVWHPELTQRYSAQFYVSWTYSI